MHLSLYICYFGVREPLVQTQVLPYLREILKGERGPGEEAPRIALLTFEPSRGARDIEEFSQVRSELEREGIDWHWLPYHKRFSVVATGWDILRGAVRIRSLIGRYRPEILHARVHVPALMAHIARKLRFGGKPKLLFDIRGFFPEEYTDAGVWKENGTIYKAAKAIEKRLLRDADGFVVLTEKARDILFPESKKAGEDKLGRPVGVIPCCVDLSRFEKVEDPAGLPELDGRFVAAYVGSFGGWYMTDEMIGFFEAVRDRHPEAFSLILTQRNKEGIRARLRERGFGEENFLVESVAPHEVPAYVRKANVAVSFIKACYSKLSSSPTKIAEYLAAGVPVVANRGVGDVDEQLESDEVGAVIDEFGKDAYLEALRQVESLGTEDEIRDRCRRAARERFDLGRVGGNRYREIYGRLTEDSVR